MRPPLTLPSLYAILDVDIVTARGWRPAEVCRAWLSVGVELIQLRAKSLPSGAFLELADELGFRCQEAGATFIINDRADIAAMAAVHGVPGVHVGQDDLSPADVRRVIGPTSIVGLSTHDDAQVRAAVQEPVSYIAIGPVFATQTKGVAQEGLGLSVVRVASVITARAGIPLVAIGGMTRERAASVREAGALSVAVITDLCTVPDLPSLEARAREWLRS